jgi:two-component system LytT family sensor kinase
MNAPATLFQAAPAEPARPRAPSLWLVIPGLWSLVGLLDTGQLYFSLEWQGRSEPFWRCLQWVMPEYWIWAAFTPAILWLGRRLPLERRRWVRRGALHLLLGGAVAALHLFAAMSLMFWMDPPQPPGTTFGAYYLKGFFRWFLVENLFYWIVLGAGAAWGHALKARERELRASRLESQLVQAQLQALRMQLHPHFLFNTLNAVSVLVRKGEDHAAVRMIAGLSDLLRLALESSGAHEVPLRQEIDFVERYLEIERIRFQDRLDVEVALAPETLDALVPNLLLQPLVENAVRHGIARSASASRIRLSSELGDGTLTIRIRDDGPGPGPAPLAGGGGVGLRNARERLFRLYGAAQELRLERAEGGGTLVTVRVPFRRDLSPAQEVLHDYRENPNARRG